MNAPILSTPRQFSEKYTAFKLGGFRGLIFHEHTNGLAKTGAVIRLGRKVLIDEEKFFRWVQSHNTKLHPELVGKANAASRKPKEITGEEIPELSKEDVGDLLNDILGHDIFDGVGL